VSGGWWALGWVGSLAIAIWLSFGAGRDAEIADRAQEDAVASRAAAVAMEKLGLELGKLDVKHVTIRQALEREVQTQIVYRECRSGPDAVRMLNATIGAPAAEPPGADPVAVPASGAAAG
jgi:hypothetical protein